MEAIDLQAAQRKLEEKRASLKQTDPTLTGLGMDRGIIDVECKKCGDVVQVYENSYIHLRNPESFACHPCYEKQCREEEAIRLISNRLKTSGIGERFLGMVFDDYQAYNSAAGNVLQTCRDFVENFNPKSGANLLLIGSPGTGKNMLAAIIGQEVIKKGHSFMHTTALRCVRRVKDSWRDKESPEQAVIDSFITPELLVIDEVGVQFGSPTELLYLTEIIIDRYEKRRPTILISNLTVKQLEEIIGARIMDRFYEGESKFLVFNWPSYRRK